MNTRTLINCFISGHAIIIRSGLETKIKMNENHFYKADWQEFDWLGEAI